MSGSQDLRFWMAVILTICTVLPDTETASLVKRWTRCQTGLDTSKLASSCPTSDKAYALRAQQMNCESYEKCDGVTCVYHCAINPWGNATIELCAPETFITDHYCPHFSTGIGRVLEHYGYPCKECPFNYLSTRGYRYKSCTKEMKSAEETKLRSRLTLIERQPLNNNNSIVHTKSDQHERMPSRSKHLFQEFYLSTRGFAHSMSTVRNVEAAHQRSGYKETIIAVSVVGCVVLLILVIVGTVNYKKGKLSTSTRYSENRGWKKKNTKRNNHEAQEKCLHQDQVKDPNTSTDISELSDLK